MNCCRLCLSNKYLKPIFQNNEDKPEWFTFLYKIAGIEVKLDDGLPKEVCLKCVEFINLSAKFWNRCQSNQELLKQNVNNGSVYANSSIIHDKIDSDMHNQLVKNKLPQNYNKNISENLFNEEEFEEGINSYMEYDNTVRKKQRQSIIETDAMDNVNSENKQTKGISFECKVCHKLLKNKSCLKSHLKRHTGFDFICEHCGKKFVTKRVLLMHCRAKHGYERTDKCSYCEYTGCSAEQIKVHERLHTGEKPYRCKACGVSFHRNSNYLQHVAVHLSEKTVQCDRCPLLFKSVTLMRIHRDNRHKKSKYQYKCKVCANNFTRRRNALLHLKRMHCVDEADKVERISV